MGKITFEDYDGSGKNDVLPRMFEILSSNMSPIAPTGRTYEEDMRVWTEYMGKPDPARKIILMYSDDVLAGYFQYSVHGDTFMVEEIEIAGKFQRTMLFPVFFRKARELVPDNARYIEAYINKSNANSRRIAQKLGMSAVGENKSGSSLLYRGEINAGRRFDR